MDKSNDKGLDLEITQDVARGVYSNLVVISHSPTEIVFDFAQMLPGINKPVVRNRIIMPPVHAKRLLAALGDNLQKYEEKFGTIYEPEENERQISIPYDINSMGKA